MPLQRRLKWPPSLQTVRLLLKTQDKSDFRFLTLHLIREWFTIKWAWFEQLIKNGCHYNEINPELFPHISHTSRFSVIFWPRLKSALRPPPSARAESANSRPFYVKRADISPPPPATKKRRKLVQIRPRCPHLATTKRRKVVKIRPCGGWWESGGWMVLSPSFSLIWLLLSDLGTKLVTWLT